MLINVCYFLENAHLGNKEEAKYEVCQNVGTPIKFTNCVDLLMCFFFQSLKVLWSTAT